MGFRFRGDPSFLESEGRKKELPPGELLEKAGLKRGDILIDYGCGPGFFSIPAADIVGDKGHVYAVDISEAMLDALGQRVGKRSNITALKPEEIEGIRADKILLVNVLHEFDDAGEMIKSLNSHLKEGGRFIAIDWQKKETAGGPPVGHRICKEEAMGYFSNVCELDIHENYYFFVGNFTSRSPGMNVAGHNTCT